MLSAISLLVVIIVALVLIVAARRPDAFTVERATTIAAPADRIFGFLDDFRHWAVWSPWEGLDPQLKRTHSGAASGVGAAYAWEGNAKVGTGRMEILESEPSSRLRIRLDFLKPFEAHNQATFTLAPGAGGATTVTWTMTGPQAIPMKVMSLVMNMDAMVGRDFEKGLASLKDVAEAR